MRLYVSGPMTGLPDHNFPAFNAVSAHLREAGYEVVNPAEYQRHVTCCYDEDATGQTCFQPGLPAIRHRECRGVEPRPLTWEECLRRDLRDMLLCGGVATIKDWSRSRGAKLEVLVATQVGLRVETAEDWLREARA